METQVPTLKSLNICIIVHQQLQQWKLDGKSAFIWHVGLLKYCIIIILFWNSSILFPCKSGYYAQIMPLLHIEKTARTWRGTNIPPSGVHLSLLFILIAIANGKNVTVRTLVTVWLASLSSVTWLHLIYLLLRENLPMCLAIIPA